MIDKHCIIVLKDSVSLRYFKSMRIESIVLEHEVQEILHGGFILVVIEHFQIVVIHVHLREAHLEGKH